MNRRQLFAAAPAAGISVLMSGAIPAMASTDPHPAWLEEWRATRVSWSSALTEDGDDTPNSEAIWLRRSELDALIYSTAPRTTAGVIAQLTWMIEDAGGDYVCVGHGEALRLAVQSLASAIS